MANIFTIHADEYFLDTLARGILKRFPSDSLAFSNLRVLLPHRRACITLRELLYKHSGKKALLMPAIHSFNDLAASAVAEKFGVHVDVEGEVVGDISLKLGLYQIARGSKADVSDWALASEAYQLLDEITQYDGDLDAAKEEVKSSFSNYFDAFVRPLFDVVNAYLSESNKYNNISLKKLVINVLNEIDVGDFSAENPLVIAGTTATANAVKNLVKNAANHPHSYVVLHGVDQLIDEPVWNDIQSPHPQALFAELLADVGIAHQSIQHWLESKEEGDSLKFLSACMLPARAVGSWHANDKLPKLDSGITFFSAENEEDEARFIALKMREYAGSVDKTKALITPDKKLAARVEKHLLRWNIHVDNTLGVTAEHSDIAKLLKLSLCVSGVGFDAVKLLALLKLLQPHNDAAIDEMEIEVLREGCSVYSIADICAWIDRPNIKLQHKQHLLEYLSDVESVLAPLSELRAAYTYGLKEVMCKHREALRGLLELHERDDLIKDDEGVQVLNWLEGLIDSAPKEYDITFEQYDEILDAMLQSSTLHKKKNITPDFIIISHIEARLHQYDFTILGGMNHERWFSQPHDMIGDGLRKLMKLPLAEDHDSLVLHDIFCLMSANTTVTYSNTIDGAPALPASWIIRYQALCDLLGKEMKYDAMAANIDRIDGVEKREVASPKPNPDIALRPKHISATKVDWLAKNPYMFFVDQVLDLKPLESLESESHLDAREFGNLLHSFAEEYVKQRVEKNIASKDELKQLAQEIIKLQVKKAQLPRHIEVQWENRMLNIAQDFVEEDVKRISGVKQYLLEYSCETELQGVTIKGRIDRVELSYGGKAVVIDYKTSTTPKQKELEEGLANQLLLASVFVMQDKVEEYNPIEIVYWAFSGKDQGTKHYQANDNAALNEYKDSLGGWLDSYFNKPTPYLWISHSKANQLTDAYSHFVREQEWQ